MVVDAVLGVIVGALVGALVSFIIGDAKYHSAGGTSSYDLGVAVGSVGVVIVPASLLIFGLLGALVGNATAKRDQHLL